MRSPRLHGAAALLLGAALLAACGSSTKEASTTPVEVGSYLGALPSWTEYAPPQAALPPTPVGQATTTQETIADVPVYDAVTKALVGYRDEKYECQTRRFTMRDTPDKIVMFSPDVELLWPGALIQGKSHRDGLGSLQGLTIRERTPIHVSIPSLVTANNFAVVEQPDQASVTAAIGAMVRDATTTDLITPSTIQFLMDDYTSDQSFALSVGLSGKYMGFSGSASASYKSSAKEHTVMVYFFEKMFEVVVEPPQTPGAFFSDAFTSAKLDEQVALQKIGSDNPPVYVSNVVYGRMMAFTLTSTANASQIKAALHAAYKGLFANVSASLTAEQQKLLQEAKISITSLGGHAKATEAMIASGDWRQYFTEEAPLTTAAPISYTFRNLRDGSIASVAEATEYDVRECNLKDAAFSGFLLESFESANAVAGRCAATTSRACSTDAECQTCTDAACELHAGVACRSADDCADVVCRAGTCAVTTTVPCTVVGDCTACTAGRCASDPGKTCASAADCAAAICDPSWSCTAPAILTWERPETADSIFYGYVHAQHTNKGGGYCEGELAPSCTGCAASCVDGRCRQACNTNSECGSAACVGEGTYSVAYLLAPEAFKGDKLDFYGGELSFWFEPDRTIHNEPMTIQTQVCILQMPWPFNFCLLWSTVGHVVVPALEAVAEGDLILARDDATYFDQVVLRGGKPPYSVSTITYNPAGEQLSRGWSKQVIGLTNAASASTCGSDPAAPSAGCWMSEDARATEDDIKYVLGNVLDFRVRVSYPIYRALAGACAVTAPAPCTASSDCPAAAPVCKNGGCTQVCSLDKDCATLGVKCALEPVLYGYVGGNLDEVKFVKQPVGP